MTNSPEPNFGTKSSLNAEAGSVNENVSDTNNPQSMKEILNTIKTKDNNDSDLPSYEDVTGATAVSTAVSEVSSDEKRSLRFNPNAVVGKATCIQIKPTGTEVDLLGTPY